MKGERGRLLEFTGWHVGETVYTILLGLFGLSRQDPDRLSESASAGTGKVLGSGKLSWNILQAP